MSRLVFLGTPAAAVGPLRTLVAAGHDVALAVTRPDKRRGRGGAVGPSPVKAAASELGIPVTDHLEDVIAAGAELGVVVAYGRIIPAEVLEALPMVNLHFSLLPRWRGAAPVERAILEGDAETGVCLMAVESGLDSGPVYARVATAIGDDETADELTARLSAIGSRMLEEAIAGGVGGLPVPSEQLGRPTYAEKIRPVELEIRWEEPAENIRRLVRVGRAWTTWRGQRLGVLAVATPEGTTGGAAGAAGGRARLPGTLEGLSVAAGGGSVVSLVSVQPAGKRPMDAAEWLRGVRPEPGDRLGA